MRIAITALEFAIASAFLIGLIAYAINGAAQIAAFVL
jgi:hypothetical protein